MKNFFLLFSFILILIAGIPLANSQNLFINEFLTSNTNCCTDEHGEFDDWVEIYNAETEPVDIGGMYITDKLNQPQYYQIPLGKPDSTTIQPGGFLLLWCDEDLNQGVLHINIKLKTGGEQLGLFAVDGTTPIDTLSFGNQTTDISYGRTIDGGRDWTFFSNPTPGATNNPTGSTYNLFINEFLVINDSSSFDEYGDSDDWVEIYNSGTEPVDIGGMYITDSLATPRLCQISTSSPATTTIPAGGFLLLWCDDESEQGILHVGIKLRGRGEQLGLFDSDGSTPIDSLTFDDQEENVSYGRYPDGEPNWLFFSEPTPGSSNIPDVTPNNLFINEFLAVNDSSILDEFGEPDDWVEIFNAGTKAVAVGGLYITDNLTRPKLWRIPGIAPDSTTIPARGFLLLWCDNDSRQGVLHTEIRLSGGGEQIGIFGADGITPIDTLTFGQQQSDISYGRLPDGSDNWQAFTSPTPGISNNSTAVDNKSISYQIPNNYFISQNYPNPFNPVTQITYQIPIATRVTIKVYNLRGEEIKTLVNEKKVAGSYFVQWAGLDNNGLAVASGIYLCRIKADKFNQVRKMLMIK